VLPFRKIFCVPCLCRQIALVWLAWQGKTLALEERDAREMPRQGVSLAVASWRSWLDGFFSVAPCNRCSRWALPVGSSHSRYHAAHSWLCCQCSPFRNA